MLNQKDFISLPYTPDLTVAGVAYACQALPRLYREENLRLDAQLHQLVADISIELAFRRYLVAEKVPHQSVDGAHFTAPSRFDVVVGGRRCMLHTFLLQHKSAIRHFRQYPEALLEEPAFVPVVGGASDNPMDEDVHLFVFYSALLAGAPSDTERALDAGQPAHVIYPLDDEWARPPHWRPFGEIVLKSEADEAVELEICGENINREQHVESILLEPRQRTPLRLDYHSLSYVCAARPMKSRLGISSPVLGKTQLVGRTDWRNIWVYGLDIVLTGCITQGEFRRNCRRYRAGNTFLRDEHILIDSYGVSVQSLHPVKDFLIRARNWSPQRSLRRE